MGERREGINMASRTWKYYQPNEKDLKDQQGDCSIRALTKFFGISWVEAFDELVTYARQTQSMINGLDNIKLLMEEKKIPYESIYKPKDKKKTTVKDFIKEHKTGNYILYIRVGYGTHLVCCSEGKYYDTWDCGDRIVYGYWRK